MKKQFVLFFLVLTFVSLNALADYYPRTTIAELFTATWCDYCPLAYEGLDSVHTQYDPSEFLSARFYSSSSNGGYSIPEYSDRRNYYNVQYLPTVFFNGSNKFIGGHPVIATGLPFQEVVNKEVFRASPIKVEVLSFNTQTGEISAQVTMKSQTEAIANARLRFYLVENNIEEDVTHCVKDIMEVGFNLSGAGQTFSSTQTFDTSLVGDLNNCQAYVFVQNPDKAVLNACSSIPLPEYKIRAALKEPLIFIGNTNELVNGPEFTIFNLGSAAAVNISIVVDEAPEGELSLTFCDDNNCFPGAYDFNLSSGGTKTFHASLQSAQPGMIKFHFLVSSPNISTPLIIPFTFISRDTEVLIVDSNLNPFVGLYKTALDSLQISNGIWDISLAKLTPEIASEFDNLIWSVNKVPPLFDSQDKTTISQFLDSGNKNLFLSGLDVVSDIGFSESLNYDLNFVNNYLHANFVEFSPELQELSGIVGTIMEGLTLNLAGGDGSNNPGYLTGIEPFGASSVSLFSFPYNYKAAVSAQHGTSKVVFFAFDYDSINNASSRLSVMQKIMEYFNVLVDVNDPNTPMLSKSQLNTIYPNPFNPVTTISYTVAKAGETELSVYNIKGQKVKTLLSQNSTAGNYKVTWKGETDAGKQVSSGVYFVKMHTVDSQSMKKIVLMK